MSVLTPCFFVLVLDLDLDLDLVRLRSRVREPVILTTFVTSPVRKTLTLFVLNHGQTCFLTVPVLSLPT